jgi:RNA polymerase sigma factor (sigma-70 family)
VEAILARSGLQRHERAVLISFYYHDCSYPELAYIFGVKQGTVRSWVSRALEKLRSQGEKA